MRILDLFFEKLNYLIETVCGFFVAFFTLMVFINSMLRYAFRINIAQTEELARFMFIWVCYLGAVVAYHHKEHITITLVMDALSPKVKKVVYVIQRIITISIIIIFLYGSTLFFKQSLMNVSPSMMINMGLFVVIVQPVMCIFMLLNDLREFLHWISERNSKKQGNSLVTEE